MTKFSPTAPRRVFCDLTHAYTPSSGGIRTYIDAKRAYLLAHTPHTHVMVVPGATDAVTHGERWTTYHLAAPFIPGAAPYRCFPSTRRIRAALEAAQPDVVELNTHYMPQEYRAAFAYCAARQAKARPAIPTVQFHTDFAGAYVGGLLGRRLGPWLTKPLQAVAERYVRAILARSALVMGPSEGQLRRLQALGFGGAELVPLGVDLDLYTPARRSEAVRARFGVGPDDVLLCYAGRLDSEKRVSVLVDALERLPAARRAALVVAGEGNQRTALQVRAAQNPRFHLLPYLTDKQELAALMASADVYVTAGPFEIFAFSVVEAQASGLPVVGVRSGGLIDRVPAGVGFLGPVDDADAMARHIEQAVAQRAVLGPAARRWVETHFSWTATFDRIVALYTERLAEASGGWVAGGASA